MKVSGYIIKCVLLIVVSALLFSCGKKMDYRAAVDRGNYDKAYRILDNYHKKYLKTQAKYRADMESEESLPRFFLTSFGFENVFWGYKKKCKEAEVVYYNAFDYIYKAEIRQILAEMDEEDATDKIYFLLDEIPVEGEKLFEGTYGNDTDDALLINAYNTWTQHYNGLCSSVLTLAINRKYKNLAQNILMHFIDNVKIETSGYYIDVEYEKTDYNNACKKFEDAVKLGLFD